MKKKINYTLRGWGLNFGYKIRDFIKFYVYYGCYSRRVGNTTPVSYLIILELGKRLTKIF